MARKEAVVTIAEFGDEVLVVKKVNDGTSLMSDAWHLPGETKHDNEADENAVRTSSESPKGTLLRWYRCAALTRNIIPGDDVVDGKWVDRKDVAYACDKVSVDLWPGKIKEYLGLVD